MKSVATSLLDPARVTAPRARDVGAAAGAGLPPLPPARDVMRAMRARVRPLRRLLASGLTAHPATIRYRAWLAENGRLIASAVKEVQQLGDAASRLPVVQTVDGRTLRVCALAGAYLQHVEWQIDVDGIADFLDGVQEAEDLRLDEIWAFKPALQLLIVERLMRIVSSGEGEIPCLIESLRDLGECRWKDIFARVNVVDPVLAGDPGGVYGRMEEASQEQYRRVVTHVATRSRTSERAVAAAAIALARGVNDTGCGDRAAARRAHVGYYLIDQGVPALRAQVGYGGPLFERVADAVRRHPTPWYLGAIGAMAIGLVWLVARWVDLPVYAWTALLLLLLPATHAAADLANILVTTMFGPQPLPKLDFEEGVPAECTTLVAVPSLLIDERHVRELVMDMEIRYLANRDARIMFALVTNARDSRNRPDGEGEALRLAETLVAGLNARYGAEGHTPFYLLHRKRAFNPGEGRWIGWERKRGKLLDLNQLLRGVRDRFPVKVGNVATLETVRYVIVLDSDTELPRDAARRLIGTIAHPLNQAVLDPVTHTVVEGYGILQPRIGVSTGSASRSWLASLYSGETGFDIYTRAVSDVYQDLFGEGSFTGKGIYEVDVVRESLETRFPPNTLLSHDLIEGLFARAGLVSDVELIDDYPSHFSAYCRRRHRWMRGDWQILRWLLNRVPDARGRLVRNPLNVIARWKILDNLRRTLGELSLVTLFLLAWFVLPSPGRWTLAALALVLAPVYIRLVLSLMQAPWWTTAFPSWAGLTAAGFARAHLTVALHLTYLLHDALLSLDAILRALVRMFVTRRKLLEWETAAEATRRTRAATDIYLRLAMPIALGVAWLLALLRPEALQAAAPLLGAWCASSIVVRWLNAPPPSGVGEFDAGDVRFLREQTLRTWRFFVNGSGSHNNWLIPDSLCIDRISVERVSPTNVAMLLNARIAAVHLGYLTVPEFVVETRRTLATVSRLPRYRGHLLNWYDNETLEVLEPRFVSTVDSGNLAAALWALKGSALAFVAAPPGDDALWHGIADVARMLMADGDPAAQAVAERVLRTQSHWRTSLPELEGIALRHAASVRDDPEGWAMALLERVRHARTWSESGLTPAVAAALRNIARTAHELVEAMDFGFLYDTRRKVLSVGCDVQTGRIEPSAYDLLASEARTAAFVAIAKGDIPQESWTHLGRPHAFVEGERILLSWTGTLFEYVMPALWVRHPARTIMHDSMRAAVAAQKKYATRHGIPWGFSESHYVADGTADFGYGPCGMPDLALKPLDTATLVVSPYSSWLALLVDPRAALANLRQLHRRGATGTYGFYEAIDFSRGTQEIVGSWMAHHQGMSLLAAAEVLCGRPVQQAFHAEPQVRATERLLEERVPRTIVPDKVTQPRVLWPEETAAA